ncbi:hypothetical protein ACIP9H_33480 [Streptomyces sp. NPDC088732]|uniref:hypothetical protein n=1 Tax=Streptomyces sp. NPDC088732 TaxID=3365879 RepID=UPI0038065540
MTGTTFDLGWGDEEEPERTADTLTAVDVTRDNQRHQAQAAAVAEAVEAARPGLHHVPDPVLPASDGALTPEEEERYARCIAGVDLGNEAWFIQGKALDTIATGRLFRASPHKLEPGRCYETIEEWAEVEKGISYGGLAKLRAAWPLGEVLAARGYQPNPGQVRELVPVKNSRSLGFNAAVALYVLAAEQVGRERVTALQLKGMVKSLPPGLVVEEDDDVDALAKTIDGVLVDQVLEKAPAAIPTEVRRAVDRRAVELADVLDRGRISRSEVQLHLLQAFADPTDTTVFDAVLARMKKPERKKKG